jgi:hypothetical protein
MGDYLRCFGLLQKHWGESMGLFMVLLLVLTLPNSFLNAPCVLHGCNYVNTPFLWLEILAPVAFSSDIQRCKHIYNACNDFHTSMIYLS